MTGQPPEEGPAAPVLRVVRGNPDATELGALVAVLAASSSSGSAAPKPAGSAWAAHDARGRLAPLVRSALMP